MKNARYFNSHNVTHSIRDLCTFGGGSTAVDVLDAVEDANTAIELMDNLTALNIRINNFKIDRLTDNYVRLVGNDSLGNKYYFRAEF